MRKFFKRFFAWIVVVLSLITGNPSHPTTSTQGETVGVESPQDSNRISLEEVIIKPKPRKLPPIKLPEEVIIVEEPSYDPPPPNDDVPQYKIQLALLLDVSGSMSSLIDQARDELWRLVNELGQPDANGDIPDLEIALYEYGKSSYTRDQGYAKQLVGLTKELDLVSDILFNLKTGGSAEYCGYTVKDAVEQLNWSSNPKDLRIIFIAGNEKFNQGFVDYKEASLRALEQKTFVNTIFCGDCEQGIRFFWEDAAHRANGHYMCINHKTKVKYESSPQDQKLVDLNKQLNETYLPIGAEGQNLKKRQLEQDQNAAAHSKANAAERTISKSSKSYDNSKWDLVDAYKKDQEAVLGLDEQQLPQEMRGMSRAEKKAYVEQKVKERETLQKEIQKLSQERKQHFSSQAEDSSLGKAMIETVKQQRSEHSTKK